MTLTLVTQLRFTRQAWLRGLRDVSPEEALRRFEPMNCISWMIGHLANQEQTYWLERAQGKVLIPDVKQYGSGQPAGTPPLDAVWPAWQAITQEADAYLDTLTAEKLMECFVVDGKPMAENIGTHLLRQTYHYWYHLGEAQAVRQLLGHTNLPQYVGSMDGAHYAG